MISVRIPTPLRSLTGNKDEVAVQGATVAAALDDLERRHPGFRERLLTDKGTLRPYVNVFCNDEDVRFDGGLGTSLKEGDRLAIVPAIAGGSEPAGGWPRRS